MLADPVFTQIELCELQLPDRTVRLTASGFVDWAGRGMFDAEDAVLGTIESVTAITEGVSDDAPMGQLTLLPPSISAAGGLFRPDAQMSPLFFWLAEIDPATGLLIGTPDLQFSGFLDTLTLRQARGYRKVDGAFISAAERLFWTKEGNVLNSGFHQTVWPGEAGLDHATGVQLAVPWGITGPGRGTGIIGAIGNALGMQQQAR